METYTLKYLHWESSLEEFGDDFVYFYFQVKPKKEDPFDLFIPYGKFKKHLQQMHPEIFVLLEKAEKACRKWGPNESAYVKELTSYGIDLGKIVLEMIPEIFNIEQEIKRMQELKANPPDFDKILTEMQETIPAIKKSNADYYLLCEELEKTLSQKIIELYPVLVNSSSEHILKLEEILIRHIPRFAEDLCTLIDNAEEESD